MKMLKNEKIAYFGILADGIWSILVCIAFAYVIKGNYLIIKILLCLILGIFTIIMLLIHFNVLKNEKKEKEDRIEELKKQNKYYINIVYKQIKEILSEIEVEKIKIEIDTSCKYLIPFLENVEWVCNNRITGKADSFIIATCLMYSIIDHPIILMNKRDDEITKKIKIAINMEIAMNSALEIISEPITYIESNGKWVEEQHPKVNIVVPKGIIKNYELYYRIRNSIYNDDTRNNRISIMQFSNLLHLIYLYCQ